MGRHGPACAGMGLVLHGQMILQTTLCGAALVLCLGAACGTSSENPQGEVGTSGGDGTGSSATAPSDASADASAEASADGSAEASTGAETSGESSEDTSGSSSGESGGDPDGTVDLGMAGAFTILAKTGISNVPPTAIIGDIGVSPAAATYITGFSLIADATNVFSTSTQVTGRVYAADYAPPTPANIGIAVLDMELAFTDAAGRAPDVTELGAGDIGGMSLAPGVYKWGTGLLIPTDVTLDGAANDVWIFQVAGDLTLSSATNVLLMGGAAPENIFWQVAGLVDLGTTSHCEGTVLTQTSARVGTGASIDGRLLAQTAVTLDGNTVVGPTR